MTTLTKKDQHAAAAGSLRPLHRVGTFVRNRGVYYGVVQVPQKFSIVLPPAHLWAVPYGLQGPLFTRLGQQTWMSAIHEVERSEIYDRCAAQLTGSNYEQSIYRYWQDCVTEQRRGGQWVLPTVELLLGRLDQQHIVTIENHMFAQQDNINKADHRASGKQAQWVWAATDLPGMPSHATCVHMGEGKPAWFSKKDMVVAAARPIALEFR